MTIMQLQMLLESKKIPFRSLDALKPGCFKVLENIPYSRLRYFIDEGIDPNGEHECGVGTNPFGLDCGDCGRNCCIGCDTWNNLTTLCAMLGIKYKEGTYPDIEKYILVPRWGLLPRENFIKKFGADTAKRFDDNCPTEDDIRNVVNFRGW